MNYLDIGICVFLALGIYQGFKTGFVVGIASFVALGLSIYAAFKFSDFFGDLLQTNYKIDASAVPVLAFLLVFISALILIHISARLMKQTLKITGLSLLDSIAGAFFGLFKTFLILSVVLFFVNLFNEKKPFIPEKLKQESIFFTKIESLTPWFLEKIENKEMLEIYNRLVNEISEEEDLETKNH